MNPRSGLGFVLVAAGLLAMVLPVAQAELVCTTSGSEQICRWYPVPGGVDLTTVQRTGASWLYLGYWVVGPILVLSGALLLHAERRSRLPASGLINVAGLIALAVGPLVQSCMSGSDYQACDTTATIVLNVAGVFLILVGGSILFLPVPGLLGRRLHNISV